MELLIPGLILVALMVWASTRIKRTVAEAFEPEFIDSTSFTLDKPVGFLHVLNDDSGVEFRGYSKEFGKTGKKDVRQVTAEVRVYEDKDLARRKSEIGSQERVLSSTPYTDAGEKALRLDTEVSGDGPEFRRYYKLVTRGRRLIELKISVLEEYSADNEELVDGLITGFIVK